MPTKICNPPATPNSVSAVQAALLRKTIGQCMLRDQPEFRRRLRACKPSRSEASSSGTQERHLTQLVRDIEASAARLSRRRERLPRPKFPSDLPISCKKSEIARLIEAHQVVIVSGETGSGKTTQLPKICLELGRGVSGLIGHTQPRRIAAKSVAARIADELGSSLGNEVGYKVRFNQRVAPQTYVKLMTDGILLTEIQHDRLLLQYDTVIIDEAHERSLNIDFLLGYLRQILPQRPDLKLIITSATIDPHRFAQYFSGVPVVEVSGRGYPVEIRYRPLNCEGGDEERDLQQAIVDAVEELRRLGPGDILVFLPGERQIHETAESLRKQLPRGVQILPLYARLSAAEQERVFQPHGNRRIVLATNVAETSLTVPGIHYVIDTGSARISRYSLRSKVQRLPIEPISQASARQRAGRCGRIAPGTCVRLYSEMDFEARTPFTDPEILRTNLALVILQLDYLSLEPVDSFPFMDPPEQRLINDGYQLLEELGAIESRGVLTEIGQKLARLPLDPRFGRMLLAAGELNCLRETLVIVSALAIQDVRERPMEQREAADEKHQRFNDKQSDFLGFIRLWEFLHKCQKQLSKTKFRKFCRQEFISVSRFLEWQGVHAQLHHMVSDFGLKLNQQSADHTAIHRALIHGLLSHIGYKEQDSSFCATRNRRFWIFPGSALYAQAPKWVMAAELAETTRLYARTVAKIEPQWVVDAAPHLLKREHFAPYWQPRKAQVNGYERISLYGLVLIPRRRIHYGAIAPAESREIFIREALIAGRYPTTNASFFQHNQRLVAEIGELEAKLRRRDILVSEETLYEFYNQRIPHHIHSGRTFEHWLRTSGQESQLYLTKSQLMAHDAGTSGIQNYPERLEIAGTSLRLAYHFEPGTEQDGVTLTLPLALLNRIDPPHGEWLVPGLLPDKIISLIKGLPKALRRNFIPAPDFAQACVEAMVPYRLPLAKSLSAELYRMTGVQVSETDWSFDSLADHLKMRYRIVDAKNRVVAVGRDLLSLQHQLAAQASMSFQSASMEYREREGITDWNFGSLEESVSIECEGIQTSAYPALIDQGESVSLRLLESPQKAYQQNRKGVLRLYQLKLRGQLKFLYKQLKGIPVLCLRYQLLGGYEALKAELTEAVLTELFLVNGTLPTNQLEFDKRLHSAKSQLVPCLDELCRLLETVLEAYETARLRLSGLMPRLASETALIVEDHLGRLVYPGFISNTPRQWLAQYPRYLQAVNIRLDKLDNSPGKDAWLCKQIDPYYRRLVTHLDTLQTGVLSQQLICYRWMLEEFRVSLFAQHLGTCVPVSSKRLEAQWGKVIDGNT